jgi:hypothetical protein
MRKRLCEGENDSDTSSDTTSDDDVAEPSLLSRVMTGRSGDDIEESSGGEIDDGRESSPEPDSEYTDDEEVDPELNVGNVEPIAVISSSDEEDEEQSLDYGIEKHSLKWLFIKHPEMSRLLKDDVIAVIRANYDKNMCKDSRAHEPKIDMSKVRIMQSGDKSNTCAHFGLADTLLYLLRGVPGEDVPDAEVKIALHIDGVQKFKSPARSAEFWPISIRVVNVRGVGGEVATVGMHYGKKPEPNRYLLDFFDDLNQLSNGGSMQLADKTRISVRLERTIADSPARALLKSIKAHNSTYACERCECKGKKEGKGPMVFSSNLKNETLRTNESFKNGRQPQHHRTVFNNEIKQQERVKSVFEDRCPYVDMVYDFIIDSMHTCYLCVGKRFMDFLCKHQKVKPKVSLRGDKLNDLSRLYETYQNYVPTEFQRKETKPLQKFDDYKATEIRMFYLYTGPVLFCGNVDDDIEVTFLMYHVALRILSDPAICMVEEMLDLGQKLLQRFVTLCEENFGKQFIVYTVHNLLHIVDDVRRAGVPLDEISAFISENSYRHELKTIHTGFRPVMQYVKGTLRRRSYAAHAWPGGLREKEAERKKISFRAERGEDIQSRGDGRRFGVCVVRRLQFHCDNIKDSYCEVEQQGADGNPELVRVKLDHFVKVASGKEHYAEGRYLHMADGEQLYSTPFEAAGLGICMDTGISNLHSLWPLSKIRRKWFRIPRHLAPPQPERFVTIPLIHSRVE